MRHHTSIHSATCKQERQRLIQINNLNDNYIYTYIELPFRPPSTSRRKQKFHKILRIVAKLRQLGYFLNYEINYTTLNKVHNCVCCVVLYKSGKFKTEMNCPKYVKTQLFVVHFAILYSQTTYFPKCAIFGKLKP